MRYLHRPSRDVYTGWYSVPGRTSHYEMNQLLIVSRMTDKIKETDRKLVWERAPPKGRAESRNTHCLDNVINRLLVCDIEELNDALVFQDELS